jgi:DNA-binding transcriptional regulator YiaG
MTHHEFRKALDTLQLTQEGFAEWLGISIRSAQRYAAGDPIPAETAKLLRLMIRLNIKPEDVK